MAVAGAYAGMDTFVLGILQRFGSHIDVFFHGAGQGANGGPCHSLTNFYHTVEITGRGYGESCLYHIYPQLFQLLGHLNFLNRVELTSGHLLAIAQGSVENVKSFAHIPYILYIYCFTMLLHKQKSLSHLLSGSGKALWHALHLHTWVHPITSGRFAQSNSKNNTQ